MSEIQQVPPVLTVVEDGSEYIIQCSKATGKRLGALVLSSLQNATRVTYTDEMGIKVFKSNGKPVDTLRPPAPVVPPDAPEAPKLPAHQRIVQDGSAPPAPELAEEDFEAQLRQQEAEAADLARSEQFNRQQAIVEEAPAEEPEPAVRRRAPRNLDVGGSICGRCAGAGQIMAESGMTGACPVCKGKGSIQAWGRGRRK